MSGGPMSSDTGMAANLEYMQRELEQSPDSVGHRSTARRVSRDIRFGPAARCAPVAAESWTGDP
jgi:hypothetical protein